MVPPGLHDGEGLLHSGHDMAAGRDKAALRAGRLAMRDAMTPAERLEKSRAIRAHALDGLAVAPGSVVSGYYPIRSEADIMPLLDVLHGLGARVCLPAVIDRETIVFRDHDPALPLADAGFGTKGPDVAAPLADPDLILLPLSAFDARGNRIGYGAGHYDRAIARLRQKGCDPRLVGIAFACQEVAEVPAGPYDIPMNGVVTENGLTWFSQGF